MPSSTRGLRCPATAEFEAGFERIRARLEVPDGFPAAVEAAARAAVDRPDSRARRDRRDIPFVTVDPPGSRDLDQAVHAARRGDGWRVHYAIADVAAFVGDGDAVDTEARQRVVTLYSPDQRALLHPEALSEDAASLLADQDRPALLWTVDLDEPGAIVDIAVERAEVRSRAQLTYAEAQEQIDGGIAPEGLAALADVGARRMRQQAERGGISLNLPDQEVVADDGGYRLEYDESLPVERWNEQISLLVGMAAAQLMVDAGVGVVRTLPPPEAETVRELGRIAHALGVPWAHDPVGYAGVLGGLDAAQPSHAAVITQAARLFRGAGYETFTDGAPAHAEHSAIAAPYAHVTAPLRRLVDRFAAEIALAVAADEAPPGWAVDALGELPETMGAGRQRQSALDRETIDFVEAMVLRPRVGDVFAAVVTAADDRGARVQLIEPAVLARVHDVQLEAGTEVELRLVAVDVDVGRIDFTPV